MSVNPNVLAASLAAMASHPLPDPDASADPTEAVAVALAALPKPRYGPPDTEALAALERLYARPPSPPAPSQKQREKTARQTSGNTLTRFVDESLRLLTPSEAAVWLTLYRDAREHATTRTAQTSIATRANLNVRTVRRAKRASAGSGRKVRELRWGLIRPG